MKTVPFCVSEIIDRVFAAARMVSEDPFINKKVLAKVLTVLQENTEEEESPEELALACLRAANVALGVKDPFDKEKARQNRSMQGLENIFRAHLEKAANRLAACVRLSLAACGDAVKGLGRMDLSKTLCERLTEKPAIDDTEKLLARAEKAKNILFLACGAGEIVADRLLIAELAQNSKIEVIVAAKPVLSRATLEDAQTAGITAIATVSDPGADMLGIVTGRASNAFNEKLAAADLVIAKGSINFQTLNGCERDIFHILRCECPYLASVLGVPAGSGVIKYSPGTEHEEG